MMGGTPAGATERLAGPDVTIPPARTVADDLAVAGNNVQVQGTVDGDVMAAGANVALSGPVQGDVAAAGANVSVSGTVGDDLRAAGANVTVSSAVADNAMLAGSSVRLELGGSVGRDAEIAGSSVQIQGKIGRNLALAAGDAQLSGEVGGTVKARVGHLTLLPGTVIHGDLDVTAPAPPEVSPQARVIGRIEHHPSASAARPGSRQGAWAGWWIGWLMQFLWLLVLGGAMLAVSHRWMDRIAETVVRQPGGSAGMGLLFLVIVPVLALALLITLIGAPLALVLMAVYGVAVLFAGVFVAYLVGAWLTTHLGGAHVAPFAQLALGALVVSLLMALPWVGWIFRLIVLIVGLGAFVLERRDLFHRLRAQELA
jgi:cytoskeletal protein CcmA (bactofilin family)